MFWLRNKKADFQLCTLICRPVSRHLCFTSIPVSSSNSATSSQSVKRKINIYKHPFSNHNVHMGGSIAGNRGPDKAVKPAFNVCHHQKASETPFKWRFAGGPMMAPLWWYWILSPFMNKKEKTLSQMDPLGQNFLDPCMVSMLL